MTFKFIQIAGRFTPVIGCTNVTDDRQTDDRRIGDSKDPNVM